MVLALSIGAAVGFAGGYGVGIHDHPVATSVTATARTQAGGEFTQGAVSKAAKTTTAEARPLRTFVAPTQTRDVGRDGEPRGVALGRLQPGPAGRLLVRSTPAGAQVFVDGRAYGRNRGLQAHRDQRSAGPRGTGDKRRAASAR